MFNVSCLIKLRICGKLYQGTRSSFKDNSMKILSAMENSTEAGIPKFTTKQVFFKISQNSLENENTCAGILFLLKFLV